MNLDIIITCIKEEEELLNKRHTRVTHKQEINTTNRNVHQIHQSNKTDLTQSNPTLQVGFCRLG